MKSLRWLLCLACLLAAPSFAQNPAAAGETPTETRRDENNPDFYLELIAGMQEKRLYYASLAHLDLFEQRWPKDRRALLLRADALRHTGDYAQARDCYRRLLEQETSAGAHHGLGLIAAAEGDLAQASASLHEAARLAPIDARILNDLGYLQLLRGERAAARLSLFKASELAPDNRQVGANLALYLLLEGQSERAEQVMEKHGFAEAQRASVRNDAVRMGRAGGEPGKPLTDSGRVEMVK